MKNKRIFCFILPSFFKERKGGAELQCYYIAQELMKRGWEIHYVRENNNRLGKQEKIDGITFHALPRRRNNLRWSNMGRLKKIMDVIKADIWYCRATISYLELVVRNSKRTGGKVLWACSNDNQLKLAIHKKRTDLFNLILDRYNRLRFFDALHKTDKIILQTRCQQELLEKGHGLQGTVIFNAHPIPTPHNKKRESIILWVGRLQTWKHPEKFIDIARALRHKPYKFMLIGRPINDPVEKVIRYHDKHLTNFSYLGELSNLEVNSYIERAKIMVNTSDFEGFSNTFIEAWLRGVPVVSLSVDPDNMIKEHNLGKVSGNMEQMCLDLNEMMDNKALWNIRSAQSQRFAEKTFNIEDAVSKLEVLT